MLEARDQSTTTRADCLPANGGDQRNQAVGSDVHCRIAGCQVQDAARSVRVLLDPKIALRHDPGSSQPFGAAAAMGLAIKSGVGS